MEKIEDYLKKAIPNIKYIGDGIYEVFGPQGHIAYLGAAGAAEYKSLLRGKVEESLDGLKRVRAKTGERPIAV